MADEGCGPGSSCWNGKYGDEEAARRAGYDRLKTDMRGRLVSPGLEPRLMNEQAKTEYHSDQVPRRKE